MHEGINTLLSRHISQECLSIQILNQTKSHITRKLSYCKENPNYFLTEKLLSNWISSLKSNKSYSTKIKSIINKYKTSNKLPLNRFYVLKYHPNLQLNYYKIVDSKKKAYWLGWLFAEGSLYKRRDGQLVISVEIDVKDGILIKRFINTIGFNPKKVEFHKRIKYNKKGEPYISRTFRVRFKNNLFAKNLQSQGFPVGKKAGKIRFPKLNNKKYDLAFLLGYFDGDGTIKHHKSGKIIEIRIFSKSRLFLEDIKSKFGLDYKIVQMIGKKRDGTPTYTNALNLGFFLYNNIIDNCDVSLPRKRDYVPISQVERQLSRKYGRKRFKFSKEELRKLIPKYTLQQIADIHEIQFYIPIHHTTVRYWRDKWLLII